MDKRCLDVPLEIPKPQLLPLLPFNTWGQQGSIWSAGSGTLLRALIERGGTWHAAARLRDASGKISSIRGFDFEVLALVMVTGNCSLVGTSKDQCWAAASWTAASVGCWVTRHDLIPYFEVFWCIIHSDQTSRNNWYSRSILGISWTVPRSWRRNLCASWKQNCRRIKWFFLFF